MKKGKWIAIISGLCLLFCYPFYFLYFIDYRVAGAIHNDRFITVILFIPLVIDLIILLGCSGKDVLRPKTYRILYFFNMLVFAVLLIIYLIILFAGGGLNTKNFT